MPLERFTGLPQSAFFEFSNNRVDYFRTFGRVECHSFVNFKSFFDDCRKKSWSLKIFVKFQRPHNYGVGVPCRLFHFFQLTATGFQDLTVLTLVFHSVRKTFAAFVHLQQTPYQVQLSSSPQLRVYYSLAVWQFNRPTCRAVSVLRRKRKRFTVSKEQNIAVYGMYDPL